MGKNVIISTLPNISQNYLPKVNTSNIFANSLVYDDGSSVLINTTTASAFRLDVNGTGRFQGALTGTSATFSGSLIVGTGTTGTQYFANASAEISYSATTGLWRFNNLAGGSAPTTYYQFAADGTPILSILKSGAATFSSSVTAQGMNINGASDAVLSIVAPSATAYVSFRNVGGKTWGIGNSFVGTNTNFQIYNLTDNVNALSFIASGAATFSSSVSVNGASNTTTLNVQSSGANGLLLDQSTSDATTSSRLFLKSNSTTYAIMTDGSSLSINNGATAGSSSGTPRMTITSGGNVGIGTTSPNEKLQVAGAIAATGTATTSFASSATMDFYSGATRFISRGANTTTPGEFSFLIESSNSSIATTAMRILSDGNIRIGTTTDSYGRVTVNYSDTNNNGIAIKETTGAANSYLMLFISNTTTRGSIQVNSSATGVNFNGTSDYRLKEDLKNYNGIDIVNRIKTYDFKWKNTDVRSYGVLAHELQQIFPDIVGGLKDAVDKNGEIIPQGVDYGKLTPILVKAIQELNQKITLLENK